MFVSSMKKTLNDYVAISREANKKWWENPYTGEPIDRNRGELLCLIHSELSEALEGVMGDKKDSHLPHRDAEEVELVDTLIRVFDYCGGFGLDLDKAYRMLFGEDKVSLGDGFSGYMKAAEMIRHLLTPTLPIDISRITGWYSAFHYIVDSALEGARKGLLVPNQFDVTVEEFELARLLALIFAYSEMMDLDIDGAYWDKMDYNANRADHSHEERIKEGGKKF